VSADLSKGAPKTAHFGPQKEVFDDESEHDELGEFVPSSSVAVPLESIVNDPVEEASIVNDPVDE
jgi:hypothetical protein